MYLRNAKDRRRLEDRHAFTLVEILIVVIILGILAMIVIPQFSNASHLSRESTLRDDLRFMRMQIGAYRIQHLDVSPGYTGGRGGTAQESAFIAQMTQWSDANGSTAAEPTADCKFGPYLARVPVNPLAETSSVLIIDDSGTMPDPATFPVMNGSQPYAWIYQPKNQAIVANLSGVDTDGNAYSGY